MKGKKILIGISAGIAAYKIPLLVRLFKKAGCEVKILMTEKSVDFVTPLTLSTLSENPVYIKPFAENGVWNSHVDLSLWADAMIIAPATANTMGKMVNGIADNLLIATYLSARSQVFIAPTMDLDMYQHPSTQRNLKTLKEYGHVIIEPDSGELASGLRGEGRMKEPSEIFAIIEDFFKKKTDLAGKRVVVSAGPTFEHIDPVRFIGNHSSGLMGIKIAEECAKRGAQVDLVLGPTSLSARDERIKTHRVTTAKQMFDLCLPLFKSSQIGIMAAAIADFTPKHISDIKIKKGNNPPAIELIPTADVLAAMGEIKTSEQVLVGFALETNDEISNALSKLNRKNLDFIVLNSLNDVGAGFGTSTNKVTILKKDGSKLDFELKSKQDVAKDIVNQIVEIF